MAEAAGRLPRRGSGRPIHVATLYRWALHGSQGIRLETVQIGAQKFTSRQAIERWVKRLTTQREQRRLPRRHVRGAEARQREIADKVERELGIS